MTASMIRLAFSSFLFLGFVCASAAEERPNILFIVSEDNGPELGCYGDANAVANNITPTLDQLARDGVLFENAFVPFSVCSPSRACFYTGMHVAQNGHEGLATHKFALLESYPTFYKLLQKVGYRTGLIGKLHINPGSAVSEYVDFRAISGANFGQSGRNMRNYATQAKRFVTGDYDGADSDQPFVLTINYPDAHLPMHHLAPTGNTADADTLPKNPVTRDDVSTIPWVGATSGRLLDQTAGYYNCLRRLDDGIAMVLADLEAAGRTNDTLVIYIGDHGAQFSRGKTSVYEAGLRVPMIVRWPGCTADLPGEFNPREELVSTIDIMPTMLAAAGVEIPSQCSGFPLQPLLAGESVPWRKHIFAHTTGSAPSLNYIQLSVRDERYKLISNPLKEPSMPESLRDLSNRCATAYLGGQSHFSAGTSQAEIDDAATPAHVKAAYARYLDPPRYELYDLQADPYEWTNLASDPGHAATRERLIKTLAAWQGDPIIADPWADLKNIERFALMQEEAIGTNYRRSKGFTWDYLKPSVAWNYRAWKQARYPKFVAPVPDNDLAVGSISDPSPVFRAEDDRVGDHQYTNYREPVVVRTNSGKLVVGVHAGNRHSWPERSGQDLAVRISGDNGETWSPIIIAAEHGDFSCQCHGLVYDDEKNRLLFLYTVYNWDYKAVGKGRGAKFTAPLFEKLSAEGKALVSSYIVRSDDEGKTWSKPREITEMVGTQAHFGASEGRQLTLGKHKGRLLLPGSRMDLDRRGNVTHKHVCVWRSDDGGETWQRAEIPMDVKLNTPRNASSEARVTELSDGTLLYNHRTRSTGRHQSWSKDGGTTWSKTSAAPELKVTQCNGSLITLRDAAGRLTDTVLFSIPSPGGRSDGLLYVSKDGGKTWPIAKSTIKGNFAYSALIQLDAETVGLFYETNHYQDVKFVTYKLSEFLR